jgi:uncharacterized protein YcaQ
LTDTLDPDPDLDPGPPLPVTLDDLRRRAVGQTLFPLTTLKRALARLGFVQADPIRAPARAQDLILRHRVEGYRAGDLERLYSRLGVEEEFFVNYGFVTRPLQALMHPRPDVLVPVHGARPSSRARRRQAALLLEFVRERGTVHPRQADAHFEQGTVINAWGGSSNATTHLLDAMHYRGLLRVARREAGVRLYTAHEHGPGPADAAERRARLDALVDAVIDIYAPLPGRSLSFLVRRLRFAVPQWQGDLTAALQRARERLTHARVEGVDWYWPARDKAPGRRAHETVRLLAPFDPVVQDRVRFELLWGWVYRFEAYTPVPKRKLGYYALPLLWRDRVVGWGNLTVKGAKLVSEIGYVESRAPAEREFRRELEGELERMRVFLGLDASRSPIH